MYIHSIYGESIRTLVDTFCEYITCIMRSILKFHYSYYDSRLSLLYIKRGLETNLKIYYVEITKYLVQVLHFIEVTKVFM